MLLVVPGLAAAALAALAIPAYRDYTVRVQVAEGITLAKAVQAAVTDTFAAIGNVPDSLDAAGLPPDRIEGKYVDSVDVNGGRIDIRYGKASIKLAGRVLSLTPYEVPQGGAAAVAWRCGRAPVPEGATRALAEYRPGDLAVDWPRWVPPKCRSR